MPIIGLLGIVFIVLKLVGVIAWSWWLVLLPFYAGFVFVMLLWVFGAAIAVWLGGKARVTINRRFNP